LTLASQLRGNQQRNSVRTTPPGIIAAVPL
jgi:hypothetical protein